MSPLTTTAVRTAAPPAPEIPPGPARGPRALWLLAAVVVLALVTLASFAIGARGLALDTVWQALTRFDPGNGDHAVVHARIPRTVLGLLAGAALGLAGAAMQGVARNPLADPGIIGINAGAALAVVAGIYVFGVSSLSGYIWFAFLGAAAAAVVVYLIASLGRDGATPVKLALAGAALSAGLVSLMNVILVSSRDTLDRFRFWQVGGIAGRDWSVILPALPSLLLGAAIVLATGRMLNNLALGDDIARGLGQRVGLARGITALGIVLLCGIGHGAGGPDWLRGPHHSARRPLPDRSRLPLDPSLLDGPGPGTVAGRGRDRPRDPAPW